MKGKSFVGLFIIVSLMACAGHKVVALIEKPNEFQGRRVTVRGFIHLDSADNVLYQSQADLKKRLNRNALVLIFNDSLVFDHSELNHKNVEVDGVFKYADGNSNNFGGRLLDVTRVQ